MLGVVGRIYKFAVRRLSWTGTIPTTLMLRSERPKVSQGKRRPIFEGEELEQTIAVTQEPFRTLFTVAALTGARISELCGLTWADVRIDQLHDGEIEFAWQVDRHGNRQPTKTDGSARTVPIPAELAAVLTRHKSSARYRADDDFVFATGTGRPLQQRNVARALREAQKRAVKADGDPTFPILLQLDEFGGPVAVPRGKCLRCIRFGGGIAGAARRQSVDRRGRLPSWTSRRQRHEGGLRARGSGRSPPCHAPVKMNAEFGAVLNLALATE